jgi:hypothetical protein
MGMIDAKQAKDILGYDDATLQQHINSGGIRAQRQGGKLLVEEEDVLRLANREDEDGTIVLTGESDNLQIDLGKVVDDSSETIVQATSSQAKDSQQITFGEDLEVVSLEDSKTSDLGQTRPTTAAQGLSFTDSNTAVLTSVDETAVGNTTAQLDTGPQQAGPGTRIPPTESGRRSVRSSRRTVEIETDVPWYWMACLALAFAIGIFFIAPFYVVSTVARPGERDGGGNVLRGADDSLWSGMAGGVAGFQVEPDQKAWAKAGNTGEYTDIKTKDPQAQWRFAAYQAGLTAQGERINSFVIEKVVEDANGIKAIAKAGGKEYTVVEKKIQSADGGPEIKVLEAQVWSDK